MLLIFLHDTHEPASGAMGVCGGDLVPWDVWRRPGAMGCVERMLPAQKIHVFI